MGDVEDNFINDSQKKNSIYIQNDAELVHSFSQPDAQNFDPEFDHINKDVRMANTDTPDIYYLNLASPLSRAVDDMLGHNSQFSKMLKHDMFMCDNMSVGRGGFGMKTLVTKRQEQRARVIQDSAGFFNKKEEGESI